MYTRAKSFPPLQNEHYAKCCNLQFYKLRVFCTLGSITLGSYYSFLSFTLYLSLFSQRSFLDIYTFFSQVNIVILFPEESPIAENTSCASQIETDRLQRNRTLGLRAQQILCIHYAMHKAYFFKFETN